MMYNKPIRDDVITECVSLVTQLHSLSLCYKELLFMFLNKRQMLICLEENATTWKPRVKHLH